MPNLPYSKVGVPEAFSPHGNIEPVVVGVVRIAGIGGTRSALTVPDHIPLTVGGRGAERGGRHLQGEVEQIVFRGRVAEGFATNNFFTFTLPSTGVFCAAVVVGSVWVEVVDDLNAGQDARALAGTSRRREVFAIRTFADSSSRR